MGQGTLSPPILASTIPAFYTDNMGTVLTVPFTMNRAVGWNQINGFQVKIKSIQSGSALNTYDLILNENNKNIIQANGEFSVAIGTPTWLKSGSFYKVQIAYIDQNNNIGYYSSVGVTKYTTKPMVSINQMDVNALNSHLYTYEGLYYQDDITERPYLYCFEIFNNMNKLITSSGNLLHNSEKDDMNVPNSAYDSYTFPNDLGIEGPYTIKYTVTTNNGLVVSSPSYRIIQKQSINPEMDATLQASLNFENGYVDIELIAAAQEETHLITGSFIVSRACADTNFTVWDEIHRFKLTAQIPTLFLCKDFTVEQGKQYRYAVQQYSDRLISNRILSNIVYADFEDAFLFDGKRQLKIKYNPKISSFKKDLLETKTDTIGGKHPFIFRNGRVYYSEFAISGLISYQMDEENLFLSEADYGLTEKTTNLTGDNIASERIFKMKVLEWLTNGEPKVFRSPTEGNFIVRLMNSSLSPNDTLGRMLHTFNCTAYEVADYNYSTLGEMGFITIEDGAITTLQWETKRFYEPGIGYAGTEDNLLSYIATTIRFDGMTPGDIVKIKFINAPEEKIKIGVTGSYYIDVGVNIESVKLMTQSAGSMTYSYNTEKSPMFETVDSIIVEEHIAEQFVGKTDILQEILYIQYNNEWIKNPKVEIINIYNISVEKRPLQKVSSTDNCQDPFLLYEVQTVEPEEKYYYDSYNKDTDTVYEPFIIMNGENIGVNERVVINYQRPDNFTELKCGNGCFVNMTYQLANIKYNVEIEAQTKDIASTHYLYPLKLAMTNYDKALTALRNVLNNLSINANEQDAKLIDDTRNDVAKTYNAYIYALVKAQEEDRRRKGEII